MTGVVRRSVGIELRLLRERAGLPLDDVAEVVGWSSAKLSRVERGVGTGTAVEELAALLGFLRVKQRDRARILGLVAGGNDQGLWTGRDGERAETCLAFENAAAKITTVEPSLVPGLLQTAEYCRAWFTATGVPSDRIHGRMARRLGWQQRLLDRPGQRELTFIITELAMRQPVASQLLMAQQLQHIIDMASRPGITLRLVPRTVAAHPALLGAFVMLEFADGRPVVHVEGRDSDLFPAHPAEIESYQRSVDILLTLTLDHQQSVDRLATIVGDLESGKS
jgi:uncharacterized protein DUF5753/helix-turn-helix protein